MQKSKSNELNIIINGDCIEEMKKLDAESVDMIFADPPYFMQTEGTLFRASGEKFNGVEDLWDKFSDYSAYDDFKCEVAL